jgi:hypothetical protein
MASSEPSNVMTSKSRIAMLPVAAMATFALAGCGGDEATLDTFTGTWQAGKGLAFQPFPCSARYPLCCVRPFSKRARRRRA